MPRLVATKWCAGPFGVQLKPGDQFDTHTEAALAYVERREAHFVTASGPQQTRAGAPPQTPLRVDIETLNAAAARTADFNAQIVAALPPVSEELVAKIMEEAIKDPAEGEAGFRCMECGKLCTTERGLEVHRAHKHPDRPPKSDAK